MKIQTSITINGKRYEKGDDIPWFAVYPFFLVHMLIFGASGFFMAYADADAPLLFLYLHGGFAILIYTLFYLTIFGVDEVKWMFINAGLGMLAIYTQIDWLLSLFGHSVDEFSWYVHVIPFLYFVLYTFLLRQAVIDVAGVRENPAKKRLVETVYIIGSVVTYFSIGLLH